MSDKKPIRVGVSGAAGRMGREITSMVEGASDYVLTTALESAAHPRIGSFANKDEKVCISAEFDPEKVDVFIDFSMPAATIKLLSECRRHKIPMVIGVTGLSEDENLLIAEAAKDIPIVAAPNMSIGVNLIFDIVKYIAKALENFDAEIFEAHHRDKKDAPSGTALRLGKIIAEARDKEFDKVVAYDRSKKYCARTKDVMGFSVMRGGDIVGEHRVLFVNDGEQLEIVHRATGRKHFVMGALLACNFVAEAAPGLYSMDDAISAEFGKYQEQD